MKPAVDWRYAALYTPADATRLSLFMQREWDSLAAYFYNGPQQYLHDVRSFINRVRAYAESSPDSSGMRPLLSGAYQDSMLWQQYLMGMRYELRRLTSSGAQQAPQARPGPPPGIPLEERYAGRAAEELDLSPLDAAQAVRPIRPRRGRINMLGCSLPLYHETVQSRSGAGVRNLTGTAHVITFFYVQVEGDFFLVAWGTHVKDPHGKSSYRIIRQARNVADSIGSIEGELITLN